MGDGTGPGGFAGRLGAVIGDVDDGRARLEFEATEDHFNPAGTVHGGVLATLVDTAMGTAVRSLTDDSDVPATSQLTVTYLRPGKPGRLAVTARVRTRGEHDGRKSFTGELINATDDAVTVAADSGVVSIAYADIHRSNLVGD